MTRSSSGTAVGGFRSGVLLLMLCFPWPVQASFFDSLGVGARPMAMGSAYTAVADDLPAVYYNPAGLAQLQKHEVLLGYLWADQSLEAASVPDPAFRAEPGGPYRLEAPYVGIAFNLDRAFKGSVPIHVRLAVLNAITDNFQSIYKLYDLDPGTPRWFRFGDYWDRFHLVGGCSLEVEGFPWASLGIGFRLIASGADFMRSRSGTPGLDITLEGLAGEAVAEGNFDMDVDTEVSLVLGLMLHPTRNLRIGYCFHDSLSLIVDPASAEAVLHLGDITLPMNTSFNFEGYYWPQEHRFGVSYQFTERLLVSLDLSWFLWSAFSPVSREAPDPGWNDILIPRLGVEYRPIPRLAFRSGYFFEPSPVPDQTGSSNYLDNDRHVFSVGAGYTFRDPFRFVLEAITLDAVLQYVHMPERETVKQPGYSPDFETSGHVISVGANISIRY